MKVGRLGEPSLPWGFAERCRAAGGAESGRDAAVVEGSHYTLRTEESYVQWVGRFLDWLGRRRYGGGFGGIGGRG